MATPSLWLGRPTADEDDVHELEGRAAALEFGKKLPRHEAEQTAHDEYTRDQRLTAAAHHLAGVRAAHGAGDMEAARKHGLLFGLHMKALDLDPHKAPPPEITSRLNSPDRKSVYKFKSHGGDVFALPQDEVKKSLETRYQEALNKAGETCDYTAKTTKERCKNPRSRLVGNQALCHWHADLGAKDDHRRSKGRYTTPDKLVKDEVATKPWVSKDGLEIPRAGTSQRRQWDRSFYSGVVQHFGNGRLIDVNLSDTTPTNAAGNQARLDVYRQMARRERKLPPIVVRRNAGGWDVVDGNHRVEAAKAVGLNRLEAIDITEPGSYGGREAATAAPTKKG